jgi:hypothetical protein
MKKFSLLSLLALLLPLAGFSQFVKILHKESNTEFTGSTYLFFFNAPDGEQTWSGKIKNISGNQASVRVIRTHVSRLPGSTDYYCWNVCLDSTQSTSGSITLANNQTDSTSFHASYRCGGANGTSIINYRFFNPSNAADSASVTVHFISTPSALNEGSIPSGLISAIGPIPASESLQIGYQLEQVGNAGVIEIFDLCGKSVVRQSVSGNSLSIVPLQGLAPGIYSVRLIASDGVTDTRKVLIQ